MSLSLNPELEKIMLSKKGMSKANRSNTRSFVPNKQVMNTKENFLKKIKSATPMNTQLIKK